MKRIVVVAPHPDDETLGCGGMMLDAIAAGHEVTWVIVSCMSSGPTLESDRITKRELEIEQVSLAYNVKETVRLGFPTTRLDTIPNSELIDSFSKVFKRILPTDVYLPYRSDAHSDHAAVFNAGIAVTKWFRYPSVLRIYAYETPSETDFDLSPDTNGFRPNVFVDISAFIDRKLEIANIFEGEFSEHPFPRSLQGLRALAEVRGAAAGYNAAESFMLLRERKSKKSS